MCVCDLFVCSFISPSLSFVYVILDLLTDLLSFFRPFILDMLSVTPKLNHKTEPTHQAAILSTGILSQK